MRILVVTSYYKPAYVYGGPSRSIASLCEAIVQLGTEVTVFTTNANGQSDLDVPINEAVNVGGVTVYYFKRSHLAPSRYFYAPDLGRACARYLGKYDIAYVCATWTYPMVPVAVVAQREKVPYVISPRGSYMRWSMEQKMLKKWLYLLLIERRFVDGADAIHCTSQLEIDQLYQWRFKSKPLLVPNSLDLSSYQAIPARGTLRRRLGIPMSATVSLFVGRLHKEKRLGRIITAFSKVAAVIPQTHLLVVGADEDGSGGVARAEVARTGLSNRIHFTGALSGEDLVQAYVDSDLLVLLSHRESFGMVVIEAMANGLPVLLSREVGIAGDVIEQRAGIVVEADSVQVEEAWESLLNSPEERKKMAEAGRDSVRKNYSSKAVAQRMLDSFRGLVEDKSSRI
jgi:glycosyltransferase involved in cell wall biosynthesis